VPASSPSIEYPWQLNVIFVKFVGLLIHVPVVEMLIFK